MSHTASPPEASVDGTDLVDPVEQLLKPQWATVPFVSVIVATSATLERLLLPASTLLINDDAPALKPFVGLFALPVAERPAASRRNAAAAATDEMDDRAKCRGGAVPPVPSPPHPLQGDVFEESGALGAVDVAVIGVGT